MIKLAFLNQKGGVGKSTSTVNIAAALVKNYGKKVLVLDCDRQCNSSSYLSTFCENINYSMLDCLQNNVPIEEVINQVPVKVKGKMVQDSKLYYIASDKYIGRLSLSDVHAVNNALKSLDSKFDYCLMDMPPQFDGAEEMENEYTDNVRYSYALSSLVAADYVVVPCMPTRFSISGFDDLIDSVNFIREKNWNVNLKILGIFLNNINSIRGLEKFITQDLQADNQTVLKAYIKSAAVVGQAEFYGIPVPYYEPSSQTSIEYMLLAGEIVRRVKQLEKEKK